ncbi:hypothetical protein BJ085DRAFT_38942, partial [Dimargaris cristalligena]
MLVRLRPLGLHLWLVIFALASLTTSIHATVYEDQAGIADWQKKLIGKPVKTLTYQGQNSSYIITTTERNILALLSPLSDEIVWRHRFEPTDQIYDFSTSHQLIFTLSSNNADQSTVALRAWDVASAFMVWEKFLTIAASPLIPQLRMVRADGSGDAIVLTPGPHSTLTRLHAMTGAIAWTTGLDTPTGEILADVVESDGSLYLVGDASLPPNQYHIDVSRVDPTTGQVQHLYNTAPHSRFGDVTIVPSLVGPAWVVWKTPEGLVVNTLGAADQIRAFSTRELELDGADWTSVVLSGPTQHGLPFAPFKPAFVMQSLNTHPSAAWVVTMDTQDLEKAPSQVNSLALKSEHTISALALAELGDRTLVAFAEDTPLDQTIVHIEPLDDTTQRMTLSLPISSIEAGPVSRLHLIPGDSLAQSAVMVTFESGFIALATPERLVWKREESLAHAQAFQWLDLPDSHLWSEDQDELAEDPEITDQSNLIARYVRRWRIHLGQLVNLARRVGSGLLPFVEVLSRPSSSGAHSTPVITTGQHDSFGIRKLAIFLTPQGALSAIDTLRGQVVWTRFLPTLTASPSELGLTWTHLFVVRPAVVRLPPLLAVVGHSAALESPIARVVYIDGLSGALPTDVTAATTLNVLTDHVYQLPISDPADRINVLAFTYFTSSAMQPRVRLVPDSSSIRAQLRSLLDQVVLVAALTAPSALWADSNETPIKGHRIVMSDADLDSSHGSDLSTAVVWQLDLPAHESLVQAQSKNSYEQVASLGRVLGDRS